MKFKCECSHVIVDQTDYLPNKGYLIPDKEWFKFLDAIDDAVENSIDKESTLMAIRKMANDISKIAYQCSNCGMLYISDDTGQLHNYRPIGNFVAKDIFDSKVNV